ncbi:alpha-2 adrenergic receptor [Plakobranchus ocellatus]|uniref:Alpha-2 adrenergic receptor n=1 Tax=Plakobranchus ocellatus TaxID=259542 RepID=A0AAV4ALK3_9GAST|nr:alpha-2 adrenergic receptor [Plakobranchus ocellatus]
MSNKTVQEEGEISTVMMTSTDDGKSGANATSEAELRKLLERLNYERMLAHIPAMVLVSLLMLIGVVGNTLVVYVYRRRFKKTSSNYFILTMAVFDLLACLIGMPVELYDLNNPYTFYSTVGCKLLRGCETFTIYGSAVVLLEIAFDRYFKICRPLMRIGLWRIRMLCGAAVVLAALLSVGSVILYGIDLKDTPHPEVTGHDCSIAEKYKDTVYETMFSTALGVLVAVVLLVLTAVYIRIWLEIRRRRPLILGDAFRMDENGGRADAAEEEGGRRNRGRFGIKYMPSVSEDESINNSVSSPNPHQNSVSLMELHMMHNSSNGGAAMYPNTASSSNTIYKSGSKSPGASTSLINNSHFFSKAPGMNGGSSDTTSYHHSLPRTKVSLNNQISIERPRPKLTSLSSFTPTRPKMTRTTVVLFAVTVAFVLSYLPSIAVMLARKFDDSLENSQSFALNATLKIFSNSFFINNAINPIIYSFLNVHFRRQARRTVEHIFCCCLRRRRRPPQKVDSDRSTKREFITRD